MSDIVVIGGGFGGAYFAKAIGARLLTRANGHDINHNLAKIMNVIAMEKAKIVINFASQSMVGQSWNKPGDWFQTNAVGQADLVQALHRYPMLEKYIHFTTPEVYGSTNGLWFTETWNFNPSTPYAASRAAGDWITRMWQQQYGFPAIFTRAANIYGEGQQLYRVIPKAIIAKMQDTPFPLEGGGKSRRAFVHMDDVVQAMELILRYAEPGECVHISPREEVSIHHLVADLIGAPVFMAADRTGKDDTYFLDSTKLMEMGWKRTVRLEQGIERVWSWMVDNAHIWQHWPRNYEHQA